MEQIQIRQPKMPAAQSFIQNQETILALFFNFIGTHFSSIQKNSVSSKQLKRLSILGLALKNQTLFINKKNV